MNTQKLEELRIRINSLIEEGEKLKIETQNYVSRKGIKDTFAEYIEAVKDIKTYFGELKEERKRKRAQAGLKDIKKKKEKPLSFFERIQLLFRSEDYNREYVRIFVPSSLVRYYRKKYRNNPGKYAELEKHIRGCRMPVTVPRYLAASLFYPLLLTPLFFVLGYMIGDFAYTFFMKKIKPHLTVYAQSPLYLNLSHSSMLLLASFVSAIITTVFLFLLFRYLILAYPRMYASHRRGQIEVIFPHVVNMMLGMSKGGIPVTEMFQIIADEISVTGEVGKEFRVIVNKVKVFHENLISAIRYVANTTPSQKFADFLDDMISVVEGSGRLSEFLEFKSQHLMDEREKYQELFLNSLGILAEVYVSALVVAPLFLLIIFVVMGMMQGYSTDLMKLIIYIYMPVGGGMFIWLLMSMMSEYEVKWTGEKFRKSRLSARVCSGRPPDFSYPGKFTRMYREIIRKIKLVLSDLRIFIYKPEYVFYLSFPAFLLTLPFIYRMKPETIFVVFLFVTITPYAILAEIRNRRIRKIEEHIPDFLKQLASLNESGLNIVMAIRILSSSNLGALSSEIVLIKRDLEWGMLLSDALKRFERRVSSMTVTKVTSILLKSMEAAGTIKDALFTAANDAQLYLELKNRVKSEMFVYVVVIYMTFAVFLFTIYILTSNFIHVFSKMHIPQVSYSYIQFRVPNVKEMTRLFYHTSLINGTISGLIAGLMGEGELKAGLKHALVLVAMTYLVFTFLLGY